MDNNRSNPTTSYSDSTPQSRSWARRIPTESREDGADTGPYYVIFGPITHNSLSELTHVSSNIAARGSTTRPPPRGSIRADQRDALPHLAPRDAAPHQRDVAPRAEQAVQSAAPARWQPKKGKASRKSPSIATPRGKSSFGDILSKSRINREVEDVRALEEEQQAQEDAEEDVDVVEQDEVQLAQDAAEDVVVPEEQLSAVEEVDADAEDTSVQRSAKGRLRSDNKTTRRKDNERGSVVSKLERGREEVVIHKRPRTRGDEQYVQAKAQDKRPKAAKPKAKRVQRDLFIPTMVTVGNFARLLKVTPNALRRRMRQVGMDAEASNEHRRCTGLLLRMSKTDGTHQF